MPVAVMVFHVTIIYGGFEFKHPTLSRCQLDLSQIGENVFTVELHSKAIVDILTGW